MWPQDHPVLFEALPHGIICPSSMTVMLPRVKALAGLCLLEISTNVTGVNFEASCTVVRPSMVNTFLQRPLGKETSVTEAGESLRVVRLMAQHKDVMLASLHQNPDFW